MFRGGIYRQTRGMKRADMLSQHFEALQIGQCKKVLGVLKFTSIV